MTGIVLLMLGVALLALALPPINALTGLLPRSLLRRDWQALMILIVCFIIGYISYAILFWNDLLESDLENLIAPVLFFSASWFVWLTGTMFHKTTQELSRLDMLEEENITDALIGIHNRRYLDRRIASEVALAKRHDLKLSIMMIDIDHFKAINDAHGHQVGDQVLQQLGRMILETIRQSDVAARYGGEEIIIIAPETDADAATVLAERIRHKIAKQELLLKNDGGTTLNMTVSIGVAELTEDILSAEQLIDSSDVAMYQAKRAGRNRVSAYRTVAS